MAMPDSRVPRVYTVDEVREKFLTHVAALIQYWVEVERGGSLRERVEGMAHSILAALDGNAMALPGFVVAPAPHPSDRAYCVKEGEHFYSEAPAVECDISGELHSLMYRYIKGGTK
jgi:hypothetical protein